MKKTIVLCECNRHTDCHVASPLEGVDRQNDGQTRVKKIPSSILHMCSLIREWNYISIAITGPSSDKFLMVNPLN